MAVRFFVRRAIERYPEDDLVFLNTQGSHGRVFRDRLVGGLALSRLVL
jgi:hypothetical protein